MKKLKILLVEDEAIIAKDLKEVLLAKNHEVVAICNNVDTAREVIKERELDLILLDIVLKGTSDGIDLANDIRANHNLPFIFISSHTDQATLDRAVETKPDGYIVKPFEDIDVYVAIEMAMSKFNIEKQKQEVFFKDSFFIRNKNLMKRLKNDQIHYLQADGNYTNIITEVGSYLIRSTLKDLEETLPKDKYLRIHKSYIINIDKLSGVNSSYIELGNYQLPISRETQSWIINHINKL